MYDMKSQQKLSAIGAQYLINRSVVLDEHETLTEIISEAFHEVDKIDLGSLPMVTVVGIDQNGKILTILDVVKRQNKNIFQGSLLEKYFLEAEILKVIRDTVEYGFHDMKYNEQSHSVH